MICPGDEDIVEATLSHTQQGILCKNAEAVAQTLSKAYDRYLNGERQGNFSEEAILHYSIEKQTTVLVQALDNLYMNRTP